MMSPDFGIFDSRELYEERSNASSIDTFRTTFPCESKMATKSSTIGSFSSIRASVSLL